MNYQAVIRDNNGNALPAGTQVSLRFVIHDGTPTGDSVFTEEDAATINNQFGLINLQIGASGNLNVVNWSTGQKYLQVLFETAGGTGYTDMGTTQLLSVPYALFAANSLNGPVGPTGPTGPAGGPTGPTGATGAAGIGTLVHAVRGTYDASIPQSVPGSAVYSNVPEMSITYTPTDSNALVTFSASGSYNPVGGPTDSQWVSARVIVNGTYTPGQACSWIVGVNDYQQDYNTAWGGSLTVPVKVPIGASTTILIQWSFITISQNSRLLNNIISDPSQTSYRSLSIIEYN